MDESVIKKQISKRMKVFLQKRNVCFDTVQDNFEKLEQLYNKQKKKLDTEIFQATEIERYNKRLEDKQHHKKKKIKEKSYEPITNQQTERHIRRERAKMNILIDKWLRNEISLQEMDKYQDYLKDYRYNPYIKK